MATFSIVGTGRMARALALAMSGSEWQLQKVVGRNTSNAKRIAAASNAEAADLDGSLALESAYVFVAVSDDALEAVIDNLAASRTDWSKRYVFHTSGAYASSVLGPLLRCGALAASTHPLQTFTMPRDEEAAVNLFGGTPIAVEGHPLAVAAAQAWAEGLGAKPFIVSVEGKALYHAAASMASNAVVTLIALASEMMHESGVSSEENRIPGGEDTALLKHLVNRTVTNVFEQGVDRALTGPIVRGDDGVVSMHLQAIRRAVPHLVPVYCALATETVRVAVESGNLSSSSAEHILDLLEEETRAFSATHSNRARR